MTNTAEVGFSKKFEQEASKTLKKVFDQILELIDCFLRL